MVDVCRRCLRGDWRCGMARCISPVWNWGGYPESGRAIHRAQDLVGHSCATFKVKAMSFDDLFRKDRPNRGQLFTRHSDKKETSMKGVETKKGLSPEQREEWLKALKARFEKNISS